MKNKQRFWGCLLPFLAGLLFVGQSSATTYCVNKASCVSGGGTSQASVPAAIASANANAGRDRIEIGAGTYAYSSTDSIAEVADVVGAGRSDTILLAGTAFNQEAFKVGLGGVGSTISDLSIGFSSSSTNSVGIQVTGTTVTNVGVSIGSSSSMVTGIQVNPSSSASVATTLTQISASNPLDCTACQSVSVSGSDVAGSVTVSDSTFTGPGAISVSQPNDVFILRTRITVYPLTGGGTASGVAVSNGRLHISSSQIVIVSGATTTGISVSTPTTSATVEASNLTIVGPSGGAGTGLSVNANSSPSAIATLSNSILWNLTTPLSQSQSGSGTASITVDHSDYNQSTTSGTITQGTGNLNNADPRFTTTNGDYIPTNLSLIDQDTTALASWESTTDLAGVSRLLYGSRDMGAFEFSSSPTATTDAATSVGAYTATLNGTINPRLSGTTSYHFELGTTSSYGLLNTTTRTLTNSNSASTVSAQITDLTPCTTYHYRVVAVAGNGGTTANGSDITFTTACVTATDTVNTTVITTPADAAANESCSVFSLKNLRDVSKTKQLNGQVSLQLRGPKGRFATQGQVKQFTLRIVSKQGEKTLASSQVGSTTFYLDGKKLATVKKRPYALKINTKNLAATTGYGTEHTIKTVVTPKAKSGKKKTLSLPLFVSKCSPARFAARARKIGAHKSSPTLPSELNLDLSSGGPALRTSTFKLPRAVTITPKTATLGTATLTINGKRIATTLTLPKKLTGKAVTLAKLRGAKITLAKTAHKWTVAFVDLPDKTTRIVAKLNSGPNRPTQVKRCARLAVATTAQGVTGNAISLVSRPRLGC